MVDKKHLIDWIKATIKVIKTKPLSSCKETQAYDKGCIDTLEHLKKYLQNLKDYDIN